MDHSDFARIDAEILSRLIEGQIRKFPQASVREGWKELVEAHYESTREVVKRQMRKFGYKDFRVDRHKVGACLIWGILKGRPICFPEGSPILLRVSNENIALSAAIAVVESFRRSAAGKTQGYDLKDRPFQYPKSLDGIRYTQHVCKAMYQAVKHDKFEPFVWSNLLFALEQYNRLHYMARSK